MTYQNSIKARAAYAAISALIATVSIAAVSDTAIARPQHHLNKVDPKPAHVIERFANCFAPRGPSHHVVESRTQVCAAGDDKPDTRPAVRTARAED